MKALELHWLSTFEMKWLSSSPAKFTTALSMAKIYRLQPLTFSPNTQRQVQLISKPLLQIVPLKLVCVSCKITEFFVASLQVKL